MNLDTIRRKITALENKNQVNYASISGSTKALSYNGTEITIQNGDAVCTGNFVGKNVKADNEERLKECETELENLDNIYALKKHTHFISDITGVCTPNINVGPFNINVNGGGDSGGGNCDDKYAPKEVYDVVNDETTDSKYANVNAIGGLKVNETLVSLDGHKHDDLYSKLNHNHDTKYATLTHAHEGTYAHVEHNHVLDDITDISTLDTKYAAKDHTHKFSDFAQDSIIEVEDTLLINHDIFAVLGSGVDACIFKGFIKVFDKWTYIDVKLKHYDDGSNKLVLVGQYEPFEGYDQYVNMQFYALNLSDGTTVFALRITNKCNETSKVIIECIECNYPEQLRWISNYDEIRGQTPIYDTIFKSEERKVSAISDVITEYIAEDIPKLKINIQNGDDILRNHEDYVVETGPYEGMRELQFAPS